MKELYECTAKYYTAKRDLVTLSLARKASGNILTHLAKQHPSQIDLRQAQPIPPFALREFQMHEKPIPSGYCSTKDTEIKLTPGDAKEDIAMEGVEAQDEMMLVIREREQEEELQVTRSGSNNSSDPLRKAEPKTRQEKQRALIQLLLEADAKRHEGESGDNAAAAAAASGDLSNELPALPRAFPISILQSSGGEYLGEIEATLTSYVREQYSRYKFAMSGSLRQNDYQFLPPRQVIRGRQKGEMFKERIGVPPSSLFSLRH